MSSLTGINFDPNVQENTGEFTVLPAGKYKACIVSDELKDNKAGTGKILVLKVQIIEGPFAQEILADNINITNPSPQCQAIGQGTLRRICNICKVQYPPQETTGLMGKPMVITVGVEEFQSNTSGNMLKSNQIKKYDYPTAPITSVPQPAAQQTVEQPQQQAANW